MALSHIRPSNHIMVLLSFILVGVLSGGFLVVEKLSSLRSDAYAINNLGVVRGSIQLISKREMYGTHADKQIEKVDQILFEIEGNYLNQDSNRELVEKHNLVPLLNSLKQHWTLLKTHYSTHRKTKQLNEEIMQTSEICWELADKLVYQVQKLSESKLVSYKNLIIQILAIVSLIAIFIITLVYRVIHKVIERDAISDSLTGLYNRKFFNKIMSEQVSLSERYGANFSLSLIDIDHFKQINDEFGHPHGDSVLKLVAQFLQENSRDTDYVFRIGGEEFAMILPQSQLEETKQQAENYRSLISKSDFGINRSMTVSIGISTYQDKLSSDEIYQNADSALYEAKRAGRNRVTCYGT